MLFSGGINLQWGRVYWGDFSRCREMSRFLAGGEVSPYFPQQGKPWQICKRIIVYLRGHTSHKMNQLQHPHHRFIPKFYHCEGFLLQMHGKNNFESFKRFLKRCWVSKLNSRLSECLKLCLWCTLAIAFCGYLMFSGTFGQIFSWD